MCYVDDVATEKLDTFFKKLEGATLPPVIAMGGPERVFVHDALDLIRAKTLVAGLSDFNHDRLDAKSHSAGQIKSCAETLPMMAPRRLVEVDNADDLRDDAIKTLTPLLDNPPQETVLVFVFGKFDQRQKAPKAVAKKSFACRFDHPRDREMPALVKRRGKKHGLSFDEDAVDALAVTVGTDLGFLERGLEKLALVADGRNVTVSDVSTHIADTHLEDAFLFAKRVAKADRKGALQTLHNLEVGRAAPLSLLGLLGWQLRQVLRARSMLDEGVPGHEVTKELRAFGDRGRDLLSAAQAFDLNAHGRRLGRLAYVDQRIKSTPLDGFRLLERLVLELCPTGRARRR